MTTVPTDYRHEDLDEMQAFLLSEEATGSSSVTRSWTWALTGTASGRPEQRAHRVFVSVPSATPERTTPAQMVRSLHDDVGFTWDQLARLFDVSRRAVHHWAVGGGMNVRHQEHLSEVHDLTRDLPGTNRDQRREHLFAKRDDGTSLIGDLKARAAARAGVGLTGVRPQVVELLDARHDDGRA